MQEKVTEKKLVVVWGRVLFVEWAQRKRKRMWKWRERTSGVDVEEGTCSICAEPSSCSWQGWQTRGEQVGAGGAFARKFVRVHWIEGVQVVCWL